MILSSLAPSASIFGLPYLLPASEALRLLSSLEALWARQAGGRPAELAKDLEQLARVLHPKLREATVRRFLEGLPPLNPELERSLLLRPPLVLPPSMLVTVEGRLVIEILRDLLPSGGDSVVIDQATVVAAYAAAYETYSSWSRHRIDRVIALLAGEGVAPHPAPLGLILWLLINRNDSPARALDLAELSADSKRQARHAIDHAVAAFVAELRGEADSGSVGEYTFDNWPLSEARRRLGSNLTAKRVYIAAGGVDEALQLVARELLDREVRRASALQALDALLDAYREHLPALASLGLAHEQGSNTSRLRRRFGDLLVQRDRPT